METDTNLPDTTSALDLPLVEDNPGDARLVTEYLADGLDHSYYLAHAATLDDAVSSIETRHPDLVLQDLGLPDSRGVQNVRKVQSVNGRAPIVVLTGLEDETAALQALKEGAQDYLIKDGLDPAILSRSIRYSLERHRTVQALKNAREKAESERALNRSILRSLGEHIAVLDEDGTIDAVNKAWMRFSRENGDDLRGCEGANYLRVAASAGNPEAEELLDGIRAVLAGDRNRFGLVYPCHGPDAERWFRASVIPLEGSGGGVVVSHTDVTEQKRMEDDLRHRALHDSLTGLPNRTLLMDQISEAMDRSRRRDEPLGVMIVDLDRFKQINDSLGQTAGDRVLEAVARRLTESVREGDTVGRWGGDEFILVLPDVSGRGDMASIRDRIQRALREPYSLAGSQLSLEASVGGVIRSSSDGARGLHITLAEETGLIVELGRSVLRQSLEQLARWESEGFGADLQISPNVSGHQMEDEELLDQLREMLAATGISPSRLQLEVTETSLMRAANRVEEIRSLGAGVWIDDFGTGYSSYLYLRDLDVDGLKIDMSFVQGLGRGPGSRAIVGSILTLGREMGLHVVAEGIETPEQLEELRGMGCSLGQGFLYGRPLPADEMTERLRRGAGRVDPTV